MITDLHMCSVKINQKSLLERWVHRKTQINVPDDYLKANQFKLIQAHRKHKLDMKTIYKTYKKNSSKYIR